MHNVKIFYCLFLAGLMILTSCSEYNNSASPIYESDTFESATTEKPVTEAALTGSPTAESETTVSETTESEIKRAVVYYGGRYVDNNGTLVICIKEGGEEYEELLVNGFKRGYDKYRVEYVKYSQTDQEAVQGALRKRVRELIESDPETFAPYAFSFYVADMDTRKTVFIVPPNMDEEARSKLSALADNPELVEFIEEEFYDDCSTTEAVVTESPTAESETTQSEILKAVSYYGGRYVDKDGTLVICIKEGGEAYEERLTKGWEVGGYKKYRVEYVKYSQTEMTAMGGAFYLRAKELMASDPETFSGIQITAYGYGLQEIHLNLYPANVDEAALAKLLALADDPDIVKIITSNDLPVND